MVYLPTQETGIVAKGPARKRDTPAIHARSRAWMHDGRQRSWVPAYSGAAVGPAMIRREEHLSLCEVRQALVCRVHQTPLEYLHARPVTRLGISCIARFRIEKQMVIRRQEWLLFEGSTAQFSNPSARQTLGNVHQVHFGSILTHSSFSIHNRHANTIARPLYGRGI